MSPKLLNTLLVLIPVMLYYAVFDPLYTGAPGLVWTPERSVGALQAINVQYDNTLSLVSKVEKDMKKVNNDYQAIVTDATTTDKIITMLPDNIDPVVLRSEVVAISDKKGIPITDVKVVEDTKNIPVGLRAYLVTFSAQGKYSALKGLIEEYEKNLRFYNINSISIQHRNVKDLSEKEAASFDKDSLNSNLSYKVYYLK